jgi:hypothetical protein
VWGSTSCSLAQTAKSSPAVGTPLRPTICTAIEGPASSTSPRLSLRDLTCTHIHELAQALGNVSSCRMVTLHLSQDTPADMTNMQRSLMYQTCCQSILAFLTFCPMRRGPRANEILGGPYNPSAPPMLTEEKDQSGRQQTMWGRAQAHPKAGTFMHSPPELWQGE